MARQLVIEVEYGVPMPDRVTNRARYPFRVLGVGDSFYVPTEARSAAVVSNAVSSWQRRLPGRRFATRRVYSPDRARVLGTRVWRTE